MCSVEWSPSTRRASRLQFPCCSYSWFRWTRACWCQNKRRIQCWSPIWFATYSSRLLGIKCQGFLSRTMDWKSRFGKIVVLSTIWWGTKKLYWNEIGSDGNQTWCYENYSKIRPNVSFQFIFSCPTQIRTVLRRPLLPDWLLTSNHLVHVMLNPNRSFI